MGPNIGIIDAFSVDTDESASAVIEDFAGAIAEGDCCGVWEREEDESEDEGKRCQKYYRTTCHLIHNDIWKTKKWGMIYSKKKIVWTYI